MWSTCKQTNGDRRSLSYHPAPEETDLDVRRRIRGTDHRFFPSWAIDRARSPCLMTSCVDRSDRRPARSRIRVGQRRQPRHRPVARLAGRLRQPISRVRRLAGGSPQPPTWDPRRDRLRSRVGRDRCHIGALEAKRQADYADYAQRLTSDPDQLRELNLTVPIAVTVTPAPTDWNQRGVRQPATARNPSNAIDAAVGTAIVQTPTPSAQASSTLLDRLPGR